MSVLYAILQYYVFKEPHNSQVNSILNQLILLTSKGMNKL